ncbi:MalM family protein [Oceanobacter sp. 3_MG-2023]|uniref:MalM family protein n=1 Tax=Oceanobacter sp. 3_MG-2023 TaxID=3062622 RepID=UPI002734D745|nr:MalM family protein [Oceanobacter sp. 3_MG-2023]MDP2506036.1 MalM family protein [Oceanobacter sp. 3_MG-2023]
MTYAFSFCTLLLSLLFSHTVLAAPAPLTPTPPQASPLDWLASLPTLHYHRLEYGFQDELIPTTEPLLLGQHQVLATGLELPHYDHPIRIDLHSLIDEYTVFYPSVLVLDAQFNAVSIYNSPVLANPTRTRTEAVYLPLEIAPGDRYLVVFTEADWLGRLLLIQEDSRLLAVGEPYRPQYHHLYRDRYFTTDSPLLDLAIPARTDTAPNYLHHGWEAGLGMDSNHQGNSPGLLLYGGYAMPVNPRIETRARLGMRYASGHNRHRGLMMQFDSSYQLPDWSAGVGLQLDIAHHHQSRDDSRPIRSNTLSPRLFIEYKASRAIRFELAYRSIAAQTGWEVQNRDAIGVAMTYHYY